MGRLSYLNPFFIRDVIRTGRRTFAGGRPRAVRLVEVDGPRGLIIPRAQLTIEVEGRDGHTERFRPEIPLPFFYAWGYRAGRRLFPWVPGPRPRNDDHGDRHADRPTLEEGDADGRELKQATDRAREQLRRVERS
jgi:hypothetical protein